MEQLSFNPGDFVIWTDKIYVSGYEVVGERAHLKFKLTHYYGIIIFVSKKDYHVIWSTGKLKIYYRKFLDDADGDLISVMRMSNI